MLILKKLFLLFFMFTCLYGYAQVDDNTTTYKNIGSDKYFRFHYDNDFFTNSDYYYTQGVSFEYVNPAIRKFFLSKILFQPRNNNAIKFGIAGNSIGFTPTSYASDSILYGDRPFAGTFSFKLFKIASDTIKNHRFSTSLFLGLIGQGAGGYEIQHGIHKWFNDALPHGWQYQIQNDIILDYQIKYEKKLFGYANNFLLSTASEVRIGTYNNKIMAGPTVMLGNFKNPYESNEKDRLLRKKFRYYVYGFPQITFVGYDATLQGGIFNRHSPYTIAAGDVSRITYQGNYGFVFDIGKMTFEYNQSYITREFKTGETHKWGGFKVGVSF